MVRHKRTQMLLRHDIQNMYRALYEKKERFTVCVKRIKEKKTLFYASVSMKTKAIWFVQLDFFGFIARHLRMQTKFHLFFVWAEHALHHYIDHQLNYCSWRFVLSNSMHLFIGVNAIFRFLLRETSDISNTTRKKILFAYKGDGCVKANQTQANQKSFEVISNLAKITRKLWNNEWVASVSYEQRRKWFG